MIKRHLVRHLVPTLAFVLLLAGLLLAWPVAAAPHHQSGSTRLDDALIWLKADQNIDGSWGSGGTVMRDTAVALDMLLALGETGPEYDRGLVFLKNAAPNDNDGLARLTTTLADAGTDVTPLINALLANQNGNWIGTGVPNEPEGGWGIAAGYASDALDTVLALDAFNAAGLAGGLSALDETVASGAILNYQFDVPVGVSGLDVLFNPMVGQIHVRYKVGAPPTLADPYYNITTPTYLSGLPTTPGTHYIRVDGVAASSTYTLKASYVANGFDTADLQLPVDYLLAAQNADGGWGWAVDDAASNLFVTSRVLLTLNDYAGYFDMGTAVADGANWLVSQQNSDGGWGLTGSTVAETAIVYHTLHQLSVTPTDTPVSGVDYLWSQQAADDSWEGAPYETAVAALALDPFPIPPTAITALDLDLTTGWGRLLTPLALFAVLLMTTAVLLFRRRSP